MTRTKSDQDKEKENVNLDIREESNAISNTKAIYRLFRRSIINPSSQKSTVA
ncbi:hypothetical protein RO3G_01444 [Rhizopus delemar RA 99-880]|uniref:Uncharacterized protein n=1 Tax=Rhizopus delemar (strain RA 99-880 / ATCC MYA-4621 / FGSC 9543 / NRRL 43880) TaxID=246409 RepID=I1BKL0_RHIO9|nr:hypothetical protein RO3G_01444 [Rhizopus delemar RA 99-880]|eukprot:EIE76740.1 hypothetical protein RO3G_01444 [Rhizopus delemar RA 99-880]